MALQTFTAGQVLTATQVNNLQANDYNWTVSTKTDSYVLVAADKGTRVVMNAATAKTITVNTSLFAAGDTVYIHNIGAGVCTITAGTATVTSADVLTLNQWQSGILYFTSASASIWFPSAKTVTSGLTLIKTQTIGTTVSSVAVTGVFSSTYDNYLITVTGGVASTSNTITMTLGATATGYYAGGLYATFAAAAVTATNQSNATSWSVGSGTTDSLHSQIMLYNPNLAKITQMFASWENTTTTGETQIRGGILNNSTQYTDFTLTASGGTWTGGTVRVYGLQNS